MQKAILILLAFFVATNNVANGFVLDSIDMTNSTFEQLSSGSDRAVSEIVADALREYMTQNEIKILLDQSNSYKKFLYHLLAEVFQSGALDQFEVILQT